MFYTTKEKKKEITYPILERSISSMYSNRLFTFRKSKSLALTKSRAAQARKITAAVPRTASTMTTGENDAYDTNLFKIK